MARVQPQTGQNLASLASQIPFADGAAPAADTPTTRSAESSKAERPAEETPKREEKPSESAEVVRRANDQAAQVALANLKLARPRAAPAPALEPITPAEAAKKRPRQYRVLERVEIARQASRFILPAGKVIDSNNYDIVDLRNRGVKLEEIPEPKTA